MWPKKFHFEKVSHGLFLQDNAQYNQLLVTQVKFHELHFEYFFPIHSVWDNLTETRNIFFEMKLYSVGVYKVLQSFLSAINPSRIVRTNNIISTWPIGWNLIQSCNLVITYNIKVLFTKSAVEWYHTSLVLIKNIRYSGLNKVQIASKCNLQWLFIVM